MDSLYSSPPYAYLPQQTLDSYPSSLYRPTAASTHTNNGFQMEDHHQHHHLPHPHHSHSHSHHHDLEPYHHHQQPQGWSSATSPHYGNYYGSHNNNMNSPRPKITTNLWEDEGTLCYQVDAKGICVARRQDNDMVNGTKLLNVVGMSRGKRDGILKNEKGRVVVKVGAMHLKGVWIPFSRATELAEKFKILDLLYPLFVDEPSIYICSSIGAAHNEVSSAGAPAVSHPTTNNKCNIIPSPLPFSHRSSITNDDYPSNSTTTTTTTTTLPSWDTNRPYSLLNSTTNNQYDSPQVLHRSSNPDLTNVGSSSPVPRLVNYNHHHHHSGEENDLYMINNHHSTNTTSSSFDYYNSSSRPHYNHNRGSFSSVSSHQSNLYSSLHGQQQHHQQHEDDTSKTSSVTTPTSYMDQSIYYGNNSNGTRSFSQDNSTSNNNKSLYIKSSPYTATTITSLIDTNNKSSAGSTTPSSWFSPETPTAVLFQQAKEDSSETVVNTKKRKASSASIESSSKTLKKQQTTSPTLRATKKLSMKEQEHNDD